MAGVATVALGARLAARDQAGRPGGLPEPAALVTAVVLAVSHPLVHYASEARGYALALAFGLAAIVVAVRDGVRPRSAAAPACWALVVLAFLSHALALHVLAALVAWSAFRAVRRDGLRTGAATVAWWFAVPAAAFAAFWAFFLHGIKVGGGNREGIVPPLERALAVVSGLPRELPLVVLLALVLGVAAAGMWMLHRRGDDRWALYLVGIVVSPAVLAVAQPTNLYAERYFVISMLLWLLLAADLLGMLAAHGGRARMAAIALLGLFAGANAVRLVPLLEHGRGRYEAALRDMVAHTREDVVTVASDHDFRNRLVVEHFGPRMPKRVRYVSSRDATPARWYVAHRSSGGSPPPARLTVPRGSYRLTRTYPSAPLSGLWWYVYEREPGPGG